MRGVRTLLITLLPIWALLLGALLLFTSPVWADPVADTARTKTCAHISDACITYELLLKPNEDEPTQREVERLGKQYLNELVEEARTILMVHLPPEGIFVSQNGKLTSSIVFSGKNKDLLKDIYTQLTTTYTGKYLPVGKGILYISLPAPDNAAISVKVGINGLD